MGFDEDEVYLAYNRERRPDESPFEMSEDGLVAEVTLINLNNLGDFRDAAVMGQVFRPWQWAVQAYLGDNKVSGVAYGPFETMEDAFEHAAQKHGAVSFRSVPQLMT
ncbi:hypothetical protein [Roseibium aggregatum]|uniref:Uncharacterized protein n=1 Tax=Roseibium aggregatum TaxID=187304 RepID=A0A0M6YDE6_9HYPH|nr:hypothetical protein [Roseibium aggregatum]CTQ47708.1 hypothetical protein LAL4801_06170 [Roseibium aggregatum]